MQDTKKDKMMTFKVDDDLLKAFKSACEQNDRTASQILRHFMRDYVKKNRQAELKF